MEDTSLLTTAFNLYYDKAKAAHEAGQTELAKRNYLLAAETLFKIAKNSTAQLREAQIARARRIVEIAETLHIKKRVAASDNPEKGTGNQAAKDADDKVFQAAVVPTISFADIAGLEDVKQAIRTRMINPLRYPEKYAAFGKKSGGGVLLFGPPGTGKTMIAKAIAHEVGATFYAIKASDIVSKWVGESERNISALFDQARGDTLAIIFIDEMDSLFGMRGQDVHNDRRVNELLQQIDGFAGRASNLLLLGSTNRPWDIDNAALRSGRFSQKIYVPLPDATARAFLLRHNLKGVPGADTLDYDLFTRATQGYSGADIEELCDRAKAPPLEKSLEGDGLVPLTDADLAHALAEVPPTVSAAEVAAFEKYARAEKAAYAPAAAPVAPAAPAAPAPAPGDMRPQTLADYIGQQPVKKSLSAALAAARLTGEMLDHTLLFGPPGLGKTSLAAVIANELGAHFDLINGPTCKDEKPLIAYFKRLSEAPRRTVVFIDEVHAASANALEALYGALTDRKITYMDATGVNRTLTLPPFTFIGATTRSGDVEKPLLDRCMHKFHLENYTHDEILSLLAVKAARFGLTFTPEAADAAAARSRGVPRCVERFVKGLRSLAILGGTTVVGAEMTEDYFLGQGIDAYGLDAQDRKILDALAGSDLPLGLKTLEGMTEIKETTIENQHEPYLLYLGLVAKTPKGRVLTQKGARILSGGEDGHDEE
ncbi:MAG: AAA family ATPase [Clostridiales bacterium]|jgi:Holliday junction DNA helicase RuvB subunit|nr:AAA family ATPase [Clostridiales bacterium]